MWCHQQCGDHHKVHGKGFILPQVLSQCNLTGKYGFLFPRFPNLVNFQRSVAPKLIGGVTPTNAHHWNQPFFYFHPTQVRASIRCVVEVYNCSNYRSCLSRSGFNSLLLRSYHFSAPQIHRSSTVLPQLSVNRVWRSYRF